MRARVHTLAIALVVAGLAAATAPLSAAQLAGVTLPDTLQVDGHAFVLNGLGLRTKFFIKVYVGGLYLPQKNGSAPAILGGHLPWQMAFHFLHGVTRSELCDAWKEGLEDNTPDAPAAVQRNFALLCDWMGPIASGQTMTLTYLPDRGTGIEVNGAMKGTLTGPATAAAILASWIGPKPGPGRRFKQAVLGGH